MTKFRKQTAFELALREQVKLFIDTWQPQTDDEAREQFFIGKAVSDWREYGPNEAVLGMLDGFERAAKRRKAAGEA